MLLNPLTLASSGGVSCRSALVDHLSRRVVDVPTDSVAKLVVVVPSEVLFNVCNQGAMILLGIKFVIIIHKKN